MIKIWHQNWDVSFKKMDRPGIRVRKLVFEFGVEIWQRCRIRKIFQWAPSCYRWQSVQLLKTRIAHQPFEFRLSSTTSLPNPTASMEPAESSARQWTGAFTLTIIWMSISSWMDYQVVSIRNWTLVRWKNRWFPNEYCGNFATLIPADQGVPRRWIPNKCHWWHWCYNFFYLVTGSWIQYKESTIITSACEEQPIWWKLDAIHRTTVEVDLPLSKRLKHLVDSWRITAQRVQMINANSLPVSSFGNELDWLSWLTELTRQ